VSNEQPDPLTDEERELVHDLRGTASAGWVPALVDRLVKENGQLHHCWASDIKWLSERCYKAEAECDRLMEALRKIRDMTGYDLSSKVARAALAGEEVTE